MKKIFLLSLFAFAFLFSSCELLDLLLEGQPSGSTYKYEEKEINIPVQDCGPDDTLYLVKLNNSDGIIEDKQTGGINPGDISYRSAENFFYSDSDSFIRQLNANMQLDATLYVSRAASSSSSIVSGYSSKSYTEGKEYEFWSYTETIGENKYVSNQVSANCIYEGDYCYVFADTSDSKKTDKGISLSNEDYINLGKKFDSCYQLEIGVLGNPFYKKYHETYFVPCNQKIVILVSDLFGDASLNQDSGTVGYFYNGDLFNQTYMNQIYGQGKYHSNECEIFYIDSLFLTKRKETVYSTLVHEFNHMINYVVKTVNGLTENPKATSFNSCDQWFTEMLSMVTEDLFQDFLKLDDKDSPKARLPYFNMYYNYGYRLWDRQDIPALVMYANTYAFGAYLVRNFGGIELLQKIAQNQYVNEEAITQALRTCNPKYYYTDDISGAEKRIDYEYAMRKFSMCLFNTDAPSQEQLQRKGENQYFSFYRGAGNKGDSLHFNPIDIMSIKCDLQKEDGTIRKNQIIKPVIYEADDIIGLGPSGFSVHKIGQNVSSFKLMASNKEGLEYYLITVTRD